ncbi:MAG: polyprenyl synthetase family protein [Chloroflexi bacterium]|nr:polyprenyl synthetase family protein [Chloroflexota bacterium]MQC18449.1 polyprenyl synthetase family protein [Chloroflexota bacterium]
MTALGEFADRYRPAIQAEMRAAVGADSSELYAWMRFHLGWEDRAGTAATASPGKLMRPVAVLLATEAFGGKAEEALPAAAAVELVHNFSLLHDDVEDASEFRRGRENLWTFAGAPQAINTGDGMFVVSRLAEYRMLDAGVPAERLLAVMRELDRACMRLVEGQYLDMSFETRSDVTLDDYLAMADGKTAAMFAAPFAMGALLAAAPEPAVAAVREYGRQVGLAFQMVDDVLGIWGDSSVTGKPVGDDLHSRKMTYPIISALADDGEAGASLREAYATLPTAGDPIAAMSRWVASTGARERTDAQAREHLELAMDALGGAGLDSGRLELFAEFAETSVGRVS